MERAMQTTQNNVANASTRGYARQQSTFFANSFQPQNGIMGGVTGGVPLSSRNTFAEQAVWRQQQSASSFTQQRASLEAIEPAFSVAKGAGIPAALDQLFQSFSQLTVSPNDPTTRQMVLERAQGLATVINQTATSLGTAQSQADQQVRNAAERINELTGRLATLNAQRRAGFSSGVDAGVDAAFHATLEELSQLADFTAIPADDGTFSVYLGGQSLVVAGDRSFSVSASVTGSSVQILDQNGENINGKITGGQVAALVGFRNNTLPSYSASLNTLAQSIADQVNGTLAAGVDQNGLPPTVDLFHYASGSNAAATLGVNNLQVEQLAVALPGAPNGNGNALALAALGQQEVINGRTFTGFYSDLASRIGREITTARQTEQSQTSLLTQAKSLRDELSGVSLDEEAALMMQYQRSYQAAAQMFRVVDEMTQSLLSIGN
jgi:flagellar hook-associated protein 1 FlgK